MVLRRVEFSQQDCFPKVLCLSDRVSVEAGVKRIEIVSETLHEDRPDETLHDQQRVTTERVVDLP
jgi:hypothetical protein